MQRPTNIEFYSSPEGDVLIHDVQGIRTYRQEDTKITDALFELLEEDYPAAFSALGEVFVKSKSNAPYYKYKCVHRFIRCNFGMFDKVLDLDEFGRFNFENVICPLIGECKYYKVICNPQYNTNLTMREKEIMRLYTEGYKSEEIADTLFLSPLTVETHKRNAMQRTGKKSLSDFIIWAKMHGL